MTDEKLFDLCKKFGKDALLARRKFAGLLPEVYKRRLFEKKRFSSIYEFAAKLAGMSHEQVDLVLRLERKFYDKPVLKKALTEGEVSVNKLVRIASIATSENQEEIFKKAKIFSNRAIEVFVRDVKNACEKESGGTIHSGKPDYFQNQNGFSKPSFDQKSLHVHGIESANSQILNSGNYQTLRLDPDIEVELLEMQKKGIDINEFLRDALKNRKEKIENEKSKIADAQRLEQAKREYVGMKPVRYVPVKIKKIIRQEYGTKCSVPGCMKSAKTLHHTQRFALSHLHDPRFLAPLCEGHHEIAHKIDIKYIKYTQETENTENA